MAMTDQLRIGELAKRTGVPVATIRFYESEGVLPPPARSAAGYRLYSPTDIRRLSLARNARQLGLPLAVVRSLVEQAFRSDCRDYGALLLDTVAQQQAEVDRQMRQLQRVQEELAALADEVRQELADCPPGQQLAECACCTVIDRKGGQADVLPNPRLPLPRVLTER